MQRNEEFEQIIQVRPIAPAQDSQTNETIDPQSSIEPSAPEPSSGTASSRRQRPDRREQRVSAPKPVVKKEGPEKKGVTTPAPQTAPKELAKRQPEYEDDDGFLGRRPVFDPFVVGEEAVFDVSYGFVSAGEVILRVNPFVEVNGNRSYHFSTHARSNSVFSLFYKVNDWADTYVRYEDLRPYSYEVHVRESKQFREVRSYFDWNSLTGRYWEKKIRKGKKREKKNSWKIHPFSQNVISAFFYMRVFTYEVGKELQFRVADDGKNLMVKMKVLRREELSTRLGDLDTHVVQISFTYDGVFRPVGDILFWVTNDKFKNIARMEAKIKIGTIVLSLKEVRPIR